MRQRPNWSYPIQANSCQLTRSKRVLNLSTYTFTLVAIPPLSYNLLLLRDDELNIEYAKEHYLFCFISEMPGCCPNVRCVVRPGSAQPGGGGSTGSTPTPDQCRHTPSPRLSPHLMVSQITTNARWLFCLHIRDTNAA